MDGMTKLMYVLLALWLVAVVVGAIRLWRMRLTPMTKKARERYGLAWTRIEARFLYAPQEAVREADGLVLSALRDRHQSTDYDVLPRRAKDARRKLAQDEGRGGTELLRQALLDYRAVLDDMVGQRHRESAREGRREPA